MTDPHLPDALRILARDIYCEDGIATQCIREAADEIERLRSSHATAVQRLAYEIGRLRLTDAEREAIGYFAGEHCRPGDDQAAHIATLRGLLERTK